MSNKDYDLLNNPVPIADQNWERNISPLVTIGCITYKHEKYIRDSIEGFLIQKTTFPVEIIIHDDASPDKTPEIISEYEQKYPNLFFTIFQDENQFSIGNTPIFGNFIYPKSRGKYIAFCEGDDYWSDPLKLQKLVDFLEENPYYSLCSHESLYTYINDPNSLRKFAAIIYHNYKLSGFKRVRNLTVQFFSNSNEFWKRRRKHSGVERYKDADFNIALNTAMSDRYIPTMSIVARRKIMNSIPDEMFKLGAGHRLIILWSAIYGKLHHMKDVMGFKNTQESSVTVTKVTDVGMSLEDKKNETIQLLESLKEFTDEENKELLDKKIREIHAQLQ